MLKYALVAAALVGGYFLLRSNTAVAATASMGGGCPAGTVRGPWFTCLPQCGEGEFIATNADGKSYCAHHGTVGFAGDDSDSPVSDLIGDVMNPFTGQIMHPSPTGNQDGPITSPCQSDGTC